MRRTVVITALALTALGGAHAFAGAPSLAISHALVAFDGHGLSPQFASLADITRVARRTAAVGQADARAMWGTAAMAEAKTPENALVGTLGIGMSTFWQGGYVADQVVTEQLPTAAACQVTTASPGASQSLLSPSASASASTPRAASPASPSS
jgi:hypothetical protein